jgi:shikimate dehydrogenase
MGVMTRSGDNAPHDYVVIGHPVAHSLSPQIHSRFAAQTGEALSYGRLLAPLKDFTTSAERFFASGGLGANVTVPFKGVASRWVGELDEAAEFAGAVNTIVRLAGGGYRGCNTDGLGLLADLRRGYRSSGLAGAHILILGAGGAVRGVLGPLAQDQPGSLTIANRTGAKATALAADLASRYPELAIQAVALEDLEGSFDLVINGTSAGLDDAVVEVAGSVVSGAFCYDMVYGAQTAFCRWAIDHGAAATLDGLGMLVEQAAAAFSLWRGKTPETEPVLAALRSELEKRS